jgi:hypothetical protein
MENLWKNELRNLKRFSRMGMWLGISIGIITPPACYWYKVRVMKAMEDGAWDDVYRMMDKGRKFSEIKDAQELSKRRLDTEEMRQKIGMARHSPPKDMGIVKK